jgi:hypothetical protein
VTTQPSEPTGGEVPSGGTDTPAEPANPVTPDSSGIIQDDPDEEVVSEQDT